MIISSSKVLSVLATVVALSTMATVVTATACASSKMNFRNGDYAGWYQNPAHFEANGIKISTDGAHFPLVNRWGLMGVAWGQDHADPNGSEITFDILDEDKFVGDFVIEMHYVRGPGGNLECVLHDGSTRETVVIPSWNENPTSTINAEGCDKIVLTFHGYGKIESLTYCEPIVPTDAPTKAPTSTDCGSEHLEQTDYRGTLSTTRSGRTCQKWSSNWPHNHNRKPWNYPDAGLEENYCRNPGAESGGAWCYTTDRHKRWDYCDVPVCGDTDAPTGSPTKADTESPTGSPTGAPTGSPTGAPTTSPTSESGGLAPPTETNEPTRAPVDIPPPAPACPGGAADVMLIKHFGGDSVSYDDLPISVITRGEDYVEFVVSNTFQTVLESTYTQYIDLDLNTECVRRETVEIDEHHIYKASCMEKKKITTVSLFVSDASLTSAVDSGVEIPKCCHGPENDTNPKEHYVFEILCVCPDTADARRNLRGL